MRQPGLDAFDHQADGFRLVAGGLEAGDKLEFRHNVPLGSFLRGGTGQQRERPRTTHVAEEKNGNIHDVEPNTTAFKVKA
nr:hypothetical protein FFPRI1PSEUD_22920 [Pseudomonas sp. FFPRI_1]